MKQVTIRRCPSCANIGNLADNVAAVLRNEKVKIEVLDGAKGEFTVDVDGQVVSQETGAMLPTAGEVIAAVRNAGPVGAGA